MPCLPFEATICRISLSTTLTRHLYCTIMAMTLFLHILAASCQYMQENQDMRVKVRERMCVSTHCHDMLDNKELLPEYVGQPYRV